MSILSRTVRLVPALLLAAGVCAPAAADTTLHYQVVRKDGSVPMQIQMQPGAVRIEGAPLVGRFEWLVYQSADNTLYAVNSKQQTVLVLDAAGIDRIEQRMSAMRARLRERLEDLSAARRKFIKTQIGGLLKPSADAGAALRVEMTDNKTRVADVACRTGRIMAHGTPVGELCVASVAALDMTEAAFDAYQGLYRLINRLRSAMIGESDMPNFATLGGVPVRVHLDYSGVTRTLQEVTHQPLPDELFKVPEDYQRRRPTDVLLKRPTSRARARTFDPSSGAASSD